MGSSSYFDHIAVGARPTWLTIPMFTFADYRFDANEAEFIEDGIVIGRLRVTTGGWPTMERVLGDDNVTLVGGKIWNVTLKALERIDILEGARTDKGSCERAMVYAYGCKSHTVSRAWGYYWRGGNGRLGSQVECGHWNSWIANDEEEEDIDGCAESLELAT